MKQYTDFDNHVEHRIRELEEDAERWAALAGANLPQLQARIRELEEMVSHPSQFPQYKELEVERDGWQRDYNILDDRIAKAKAILERALKSHDAPKWIPIEHALAALEGK